MLPSGLRRTSLLAILIATTLSACTNGRIAEPGMAVTQPVSALNQDAYNSSAMASHIVRPNDIISVDVFREEELSLEQVRVTPTGDISMPLLGQVAVLGLTPAEIEARVETLLGARYLRDPQVSVNVVQYGSHQVTVEGSVENPGLFDFRPGTRLSGAIAMANGMNRVADYNEVAVFRQVEGGIAVAKFDYAAVRSGTMLDPVLEPGDRVVIGTSSLSQFWQDVLRALPLFALFTRI